MTLTVILTVIESVHYPQHKYIMKKQKKECMCIFCVLCVCACECMESNLALKEFIVPNTAKTTQSQNKHQRKFTQHNASLHSRIPTPIYLPGLQFAKKRVRVHVQYRKQNEKGESRQKNLVESWNQSDQIRSDT
jgi:hypothetical protein